LELKEIKNMERPGFIHTVYFWLNDDATVEDRQSFHQGVAEQTKCKTVLDAFIGPPASTRREVVDHTYEYALLVFFKNKADHDSYQIDPDHDRFIANYKHLWKRVQVYDHVPIKL
jgi:hypothetical protein